MQIGGMRFARIERDDHALTLEIDFYVLHAGDFHQNRSQLAHTLVAFFAFGRDLDRFQDFVIAPFRKKWIGRIGITGSCRVHRVWLSLNLTFEASALVAPLVAASLWQATRRCGNLPPSPPTGRLQFRHFARHRFEHAPDVFRKDLLTGCIRMNAVGQIQRGIACYAFK